MVRTYAWNASVQSNIPFDDAKTYSETVSESTVDSGIDCPASYARPDKDIHDLLSKSAPVNRPTIEKGATLYGVHTVHIEGQTYFQPFDCAMHQFINSQYSAAHDNRPYIAHNYLPLVNERSANFPVSVQAEHLAMLAAIQSAARSPSHSAERPRKETFSESWKKAEEEEGNDPLNESFKSGHNSLPDFAYDGSMIDELPWARGNPQPKTGVRGKAAWYVNDGYLNTSFARERLGQPQTFVKAGPTFWVLTYLMESHGFCHGTYMTIAHQRIFITSTRRNLGRLT
uniref:Chitin synthase n=1 Tax=Steinernema glaseri TaxID=37863 RepID=A0A1I7Y870_9BILA